MRWYAQPSDVYPTKKTKASNTMLLYSSDMVSIYIIGQLYNSLLNIINDANLDMHRIQAAMRWCWSHDHISAQGRSNPLTSHNHTMSYLNLGEQWKEVPRRYIVRITSYRFVSIHKGFTRAENNCQTFNHSFVSPFQTAPWCHCGLSHPRPYRSWKCIIVLAARWYSYLANMLVDGSCMSSVWKWQSPSEPKSSR